MNMLRILKKVQMRTLRVGRRWGELPKEFSLFPVVQHRSRRFHSTESLLNRLRSGDLTKSEVVRLIVNNESLKVRMNELERSNKSGNNQDSSSSNKSYSSVQQETSGGALSLGYSSGSSRGTITNLGSRANPVYMKKQTTFREFMMSLFPFLFIFWMLGGLDMVKNRKQGNVGGGGMFGKNYSEWDENDWEEDDESAGSSSNASGNEEANKNKSVTDEANKKDENGDLRSDFFRRLGVNLNKPNSENDGNKSKSKEKREKNSSTSNEIDPITGASVPKKKHKRVRFRDVCGNDEAKMDLQDLVDYLKNPQKYQQMGCKLPKGVLLSGPPGTGKTLLARALAGEAGVPFFATNGASFDEIFVGVGVMRVKKLFERAKEKSPCIVFIDEIDAIANTRMQMGTAHSSDSLNALLSEMDGFEQNAGIIVIAATNMPDRLDHALVRPGRFDRKVYIQLPDSKARRDIVGLYLKDRQDSDVDLDLLVSDISGFSGAELESMVNIASIEAVKQAKKKINMSHLIEAKEIISMGRARTTQMSPEVKRVTAYHESGHAIVSLFTKGSKPIYKATILPRGPALGFVASSNADEYMSTKESLLAQLDICMGGRASEAIFSGSTKITTGASSDFNQATQIATAMVCQYGMSPKVGHVYYSSEQISKLSPELQNLINNEVKRLLDESYQRATRLILDNKDKLEIVAQELLRKETLSGEEIKVLIGWDGSQMREPSEGGSLFAPSMKSNNRMPFNTLQNTMNSNEKNYTEVA